MINIPLIITVPTGISMEGAFAHDIFQMIIQAGPMVKCVMFVLFLFSIISWTIIFIKLRLLRKAKQDSYDFLELFWGGRDFDRIYSESEEMEASPLTSIFRAGYNELSRIREVNASFNSEESKRTSPGIEKTSRFLRAIMGNMERSLRKENVEQINHMERAINFLATTGNTAPFIGLFGTVWGIMNSFRGIGLKGSANLAVVAPGISEALIATAAGLAAAIPAVMAFNYFIHKISALRAEMDIFTSDFLSMVERQLFEENLSVKTDR